MRWDVMDCVKRRPAGAVGPAATTESGIWTGVYGLVAMAVGKMRRGPRHIERRREGSGGSGEVRPLLRRRRRGAGRLGLGGG